MTGEIGILNVGAGDTKLTFDNKNAAETIRAARMVTDMLRRGYALLIEVEQPDGTKAYQRAWDFDEAKSEYIIADFDPVSEPHAPREPERRYVPPPRYGSAPAGEPHGEEISETSAGAAEARAAETDTPRAVAKGRPRGSKRIAASSTRAVAVARSAGG